MKKIMFNDAYGLTAAVLDGRKTMTRRVAKLPHGLIASDVWNPVMGIDDKGVVYFTVDCIDAKQRDLYPKYKIGEEVAVAQSYHSLNKNGYIAPEWCEHTCEDSAGYENKMFVRAALMPHRIRITNIKLERMKDITDEDALREGIYAHTVDLDETPGVHPYTSYAYNALKGSNKKRWWFETPKKAFEALIDKVSGKGTWKSNPWVWVYEFELIKE